MYSYAAAYSCGAWVWRWEVLSDAAAMERCSRRWIANRAATPKKYNKILNSSCVFDINKIQHHYYIIIIHHPKAVLQ